MGKMNYSFKDFTGQILIDRDDMEGVTIKNSCFAQETPDTIVFPSVKNLTLINCNLDNVVIDPNWIVIDCSVRRYKVQNDLRDWEVDADGKPIKLTDEEFWKVQGVSILATDIPEIQLTDISEVRVDGTNKS